MALGKPIKQLSEPQLREEYEKLYGCSKASDIDRLKSVIDEFQERRLPLPGSARDEEGSKRPKKTTEYKPKKIEIKKLGKILIVDDDKRLATVIGTQVQALHFEPVIHHNGQAALNYVEKKGLPLVAIIDQNMPGINGVTLCSRLRALPDGQELPILMITGLSDRQTVTGAVMAGVTAFIKKPFQVKELIDRIKSLTHHEERLKRSKGSGEIRSTAEAEATQTEEDQ